ncbi:aspartic proteinase nepenthesin-1-like [Silene latifolia]|uniref:aspartic proteinase nepenthesin-1-like n=1 Tax=Silene latifolia TaxID=37657 RepID=UPI003D77BE5A
MSKVSNYPIRLTPNGLKSQVRSDGGNYYVTKLPLGTGKGHLSPIMIIDTASHETWIQCEDCYPCIESKEKNFNYKLSTTFKRMSVDDPLCNPRLTYEGSCALHATYGDAHAFGIVGKDVVFFQNALTGKPVAIQGFAFGCALKNEGFKFYTSMRENSIVGIHGLALGPRSFLSQSRSHTKGRFSYCLAAGLGISNMYFGDEAQISGDATKEVRTIAMNKWIKYHVYLNAISVEGIRISFDPSIFELDPIGYTKGFFVDSGAPYTVLTRSAFKPIKDAVVKYLKEKYDWQPTPTPLPGLCFETTKYPSDVQLFPSVIFHFAGIGQQGEVDWVMDKNYLFQKKNQGFCMAMFSVDDPGPSLLGRYQQINFKVLFDVDNGLLSFLPQVCHEASF